MRRGLWDHGRRLAPLAIVLLAGCKAAAPPAPSAMLFSGLPISGTLEYAKRSGFTDCLYMDAVRLRCRKHDVSLAGQGPYEAAIDFRRSDGSGGFNQLTLWHPWDQYAVYKIRDALIRQGWFYCRTGTGQRGDQVIFTYPGKPVRISMDLSYWGKRRLRVIPSTNTKEPVCKPTHGPGLPGR